MSKNKILCIPGWGGHPTAFGGYDKLIPEYPFRFVKIIDWQKALEDIKDIARQEQKLILFCSCYGIQFALRLIEEMPDSVTHLVLIEPFLAQFYWWRRLAAVAISVLVKFLKFTDYFGLRRKKFPYEDKIDYMKLAKYPIFFQPFFDVRWQNITDYFGKIYDTLTFELPPRINVKTLFVFSPSGYFASPVRRKKLFNYFTNHDVVEVGKNTHNVITVSKKEVVNAIRQWLEQNGKL